MEIDLFTLIAQIVNFLILVLILRQLLYKRIVRAMDERENRIASRLEEADAKEKKADEQEEKFRRKQEELEEARREKLDEAAKEAEQRREELLEEARDGIEKDRRRWRESLQNQKRNFLTRMRDTVSRQTCAIARRTLGDLADAELERHIARSFAQRLDDLDDDRREELRGELGSDAADVRITSAFDLDDESADMLRDAVRDLLGNEADAAFEKDDELICGIELHAGDHSVAWSVDAYLTELEQELEEELEEERGGSERNGEEREEDTGAEEEK